MARTTMTLMTAVPTMMMVMMMMMMMMTCYTHSLLFKNVSEFLLSPNRELEMTTVNLQANIVILRKMEALVIKTLILSLSRKCHRPLLCLMMMMTMMMMMMMTCLEIPKMTHTACLVPHRHPIPERKPKENQLMTQWPAYLGMIKAVVAMSTKVEATRSPPLTHCLIKDQPVSRR